MAKKTTGTTDPNAALITKIQELIEAVKASYPATTRTAGYQDLIDKFKERFVELQKARNHEKATLP